MKRLSIALAALGLSASAFAAYPAATNPTEVSVPQLPGGVYIGATAYYLQASDANGDLDYASVNTLAPRFVSEVKRVDPGYDWGWGINLGYIFPGTGNNVEATYFHLDTDDTDKVSVATPNASGLVPLGLSLDTLGASLGPNTFASGKAEYDIDQVDVTAGQYIDVGCRLTLHPNVGVRWTSLDRDLSTHYVGFAGPGPLAAPLGDELFAKDSSDFDGVGPLVGLDASYYIGWGIGAVAHLDSALLVGDIDDKVNATFLNRSPAGALLSTTASELKIDSTHRAVPVVDAKLGADWTYAFNNTINSDLTLEVGYQLSNYYNAVDKIVGSPAVVTSDGIVVLPVLGGHFTSDVGLNGPYVNLTFHA